MTMLVLDEFVKEQIIADRQARGIDRFDEVWDGVYMMSPLANNEHQKLASRLASIMDTVIDEELGGLSFCGCNVSDQTVDWKRNFRCPDVAVFLADTEAKDRETHWLGGPDFAIEITSAKDCTWDKLDFYAKVQTRELLIVERDPWQLVLLRLQEGKLFETGRTTIATGNSLTSSVVPISFRLIMRNQRPTIEVKHQIDGRVWYAQGAQR